MFDNLSSGSGLGIQGFASNRRLAATNERIPEAVLPTFDWQGGDTGTKRIQAVNEFHRSGNLVFEAIFGRDNLRGVAVLEKALRIQSTVCRVREPRPGTGFLIGEDLMITNNHVIRTIEEAQAGEIILNYQLDGNGVSLPTDDYSLDPASFFFTSQELDCTIVRVRGTPGRKWGFILLEKVVIREGDSALIIQHPDGDHKKISLGDNEVKAVIEGGRKIQYLTDTRPGSSGSPVFNDDMELIALHHSSVLTPDQTNYFRNQAIAISAIIDVMPSEVPRRR